jgi:hypothetical protein
MSSLREPRPTDITAPKPSASSFNRLKLYNPFSPGAGSHHGSSPVDKNYKSIPIPDRGHGKVLKKGAMDPFEVRIRFTQHLQHLNASVTSANKAAQYAIKYRDMDEDLHSCILEQLERVCVKFHDIFHHAQGSCYETLTVSKRRNVADCKPRTP